MPIYWQTTKYRRAATAEIRLQHLFRLAQSLRYIIRAKEVFTLKYLMQLNLGLGIWLMISPFVLELVTQRAFRVGWEDFLLGFAIATFSFCRLSSPRGAEFLDFLIVAVGLTTMLNPFLYHYFNIEVVAWNNVVVGSIVFFLAIFEDYKNSASSKTVEANRDA